MSDPAAPFEEASARLHTTPEGRVRAACHCGTVRFEVRLTDGLNTARRCTGTAERMVRRPTR